MILQAIDDFDIDAKSSILIGDKATDIKAAISAGIGTNIYFGEMDIGNDVPERYYNKIYEDVKTRFYGRPVTIHRMSTAKWFDTFDQKLDWIYVDASHAYEGCLHDLTRAVGMIKPGGKLFGDDYGPKKQGVKNAVDQFIKNTGYTLNNFHDDQFEVQL